MVQIIKPTTKRKPDQSAERTKRVRLRKPKTTPEIPKSTLKSRGYVRLKEPTRTELYEKLAELKIKADALKKERRTLQADLIEKYGDKKVYTTSGILTLAIKEKWEMVQRATVIRKLTQTVFNKYAGISKSAVIKAVGEAKFKDIADHGGFELKSSSKYYALKKK